MRARPFATRLGIWIVVVGVHFVRQRCEAQVYFGRWQQHEVFVGTETENISQAIWILPDTSSKQVVVDPANVTPGQISGLAQAASRNPWEAV